MPRPRDGWWIQKRWIYLSVKGPIYLFTIELGPGGRWLGLHIGERDV